MSYKLQYNQYNQNKLRFHFNQIKRVEMTFKISRAMLVPQCLVLE